MRARISSAFLLVLLVQSWALIVLAEPETSEHDPSDVAWVNVLDTSLTVRSADVGTAGSHFSAVREDPAMVKHLAPDATKFIVPPLKIKWGGINRDGIPSIDQPTFAGPEYWDALNYQEEGLVIGLEVDGQHRAYPFQILTWHEIVNETIAGKHLLVTY